jgi:hypothetical protein
MSDDPIDDLLEGLGNLNWITPLGAEIRDIVEGGGYPIFFADDCAWGEASKVLRRQGISAWGTMIVNGQLFTTVRPSDAAGAMEALQRAGIGMLNDEATVPKPAKQPVPQPQPAGSLVWGIETIW